jgi:ABC-type Zn2+ transport system substrate-binding protein/surface adhesin
MQMIVDKGVHHSNGATRISELRMLKEEKCTSIVFPEPNFFVNVVSSSVLGPSRARDVL